MIIIFSFQQILCYNEGQIHVPSQGCHVNGNSELLVCFLITDSRDRKFELSQQGLNESPKCLTSLLTFWTVWNNVHCNLGLFKLRGSNGHFAIFSKVIAIDCTNWRSRLHYCKHQRYRIYSFCLNLTIFGIASQDSAIYPSFILTFILIQIIGNRSFTQVNQLYIYSE